METCAYTEVLSEEKKDNIPRKYLFRQVFVSSGVWTMFFISGLNIGAPTVFVPQLRREINDTRILGDEMASWLYSVFGFAAIPWVVSLPILIRFVGCRITFIVMAIDIFITYIIFCTSSNPLQILVSEIIFSFAYAGTLIIGMYVITEYTDPKYRGLFLTIKSASLFWGVWCSNAIGTFLHWKWIGAVGTICCIYIMISCFFWRESPYWLAGKGRFEECRRSHRWLFSSGIDSERNLETLISLDRPEKAKWTLQRLLITVSTKAFIKPLALSFLLLVQYNLTGKFVCTIYSIDIIKKITKDEATAYTGMLILDGATVFSTYFGCFLSKLFKRKTLYLATSTIGITSLIVMSAYLYSIKLGIVVENNVISICLLMCFSIPISCGPMILNTSISAELVPLRYREVTVLTITLVFYFLVAFTLKVAPFLFKTLDMHGTLLFYAISSGACTLLLYLYLPETKDKSLQEIEEFFKGKVNASAQERNNLNEVN